MRITLLFTLLLVFGSSYAQKTNVERRKALDEIAKEAKADAQQRKKRVEAYVKAKGLEIVQIDQQYGTRVLYDVDRNGMPVYLETENTGAAATTGAKNLLDGQTFGFKIDGDGVKIGIWDGGIIRSSHVELSGNVSQQDIPPGLSDHANHVAGTILAKGVNSQAKGMAPGATAFTYDFNNDLSEMIERAPVDDTGILLSNHSYGPTHGWTRGTWNGDPSISTQEDYRFGLYNDRAVAWDNLSFNSPYYLIVTSAGNHRTDSGDGTFPPDGPYDIISGVKTAKNILTVGAVNKINKGYESREDVIMSSFSSWGPTDDGRIKPDIVGAGVNLFSSYSGTDQSYGTISGTSMATPNVVGSLALIQDLNKRLNGQFLKAATLKAIAIHTANEAGIAAGPDYQFGWGLMNAVGAADQLISQNNSNRIIDEIVLENGETYSLNILPKENSAVKVTIYWHDLPGTPPAPQLDPEDLMLVNDLDLRVTNSQNTYMPWILNPAIPGGQATKGDNFRDNVEKVEFVAESDEGYTITVNHKGELTSGSQEFSLIVTYESAESKTLYRIGSGLEWNNEQNWSFSSGGEPAMAVPRVDDNVIFDRNSFSNSEESSNASENTNFVLDQNIEVNKFIISAEAGLQFDLNGFSITTYEGISTVSGDVNFKGEGEIILKDLTQGKYSLNGSATSFRDVDVIVDFTFGSEAVVSRNMEFNNLTLENGRITVNDNKVKVSFLNVKNESELNLTNTTLTVLNELNTTESSSLSLENSSLIASNDNSLVSFDLPNKNLNGEVHSKGSGLIINGDFSVVSLINESVLKLNGDTETQNLDLRIGSETILLDAKSLLVKNEIKTQGTLDEKLTIRSTGSSNIQLEGRRVICLDFLNIESINILGEATVNAGENSVISNSNNWQQRACEDVLFADFTFETVCVGSVEKFTDASTGVIESRNWYVNDVLVSTEVSPNLEFPEAGEYTVRLEIKESEELVNNYFQTINTIDNTLPENEILLSGNQLVSRIPADSYQWFNNGELLEGETGRTLNLIGLEGAFFVVANDETCSRKSPEFEFRVTSSEEDLFDSEYNLYPNPASEALTIEVQSAYTGTVEINMLDLSGRRIYSKSFDKNGFQLKQSIDTNDLPNGLYLVRIMQGQSEISKLIAVEQ